jgi:hypothetical protein
MLFMVAFALLVALTTLIVQRLAYALSEALIVEMREVRILYAWLTYAYWRRRIERKKRGGTLRSLLEWFVTWYRPRRPGPELVPAPRPASRRGRLGGP